jgi:hypothetical protein
MAMIERLDLSCNPVTAVGLVNLVHPKKSRLISNDLNECKVSFRLAYLNLSHNKLAFLLNYAIELGLVNSGLQDLLLYNCSLDDEQCLKLADSK